MTDNVTSQAPITRAGGYTVPNSDRLTPEDLGDMVKLFEVLDLFTAIRPTVSHQLIKTFLLVAMDEGKSLEEYAVKNGVSKSVISYHMLDLGPTSRQKVEGMKLVIVRENPINRRKKEAWLTPRGHSLVQRILRRMRAR